LKFTCNIGRLLAFGKKNKPPDDRNSVRVERDPLPLKQKG
jgi:hypothetical protein